MSAAACVDHVFSVMAATYGASWDRSLGTAPVADVKTIWGDSLGDFLHSEDAKRAIVWGLKNLPDTVPNSRQFRSLCRQAPAKKLEELPAPAVNPEIALKVLSGIRKSTERFDQKAWAPRIIARHAGGARISPTVLAMAREVVGGV